MSMPRGGVCTGLDNCSVNKLLRTFQTPKPIQKGPLHRQGAVYSMAG
jgi:hypothetical protein